MAKDTPSNKTYSSRGLELSERIVSINRVSKVVKGGKRFRFSVLVVVGDGVSQVGLEVMLRPAAPGTGVIAGGAVRAIMELGGVKDILTKVIGRTSNPINVSYATMSAVKNLRTPEEIRRLRGKDRKEA